jgi:hypothetical protein
MVPGPQGGKERTEGLGIVHTNFTEHKGRPEKLHYFQYRDEHVRILKEKQKKLDDKTFIKDEMKLMTKIGFADSNNRSSNIPNNTLMRMNITATDNKAFSSNSMYWKSKEKEKEMKIKQENDQLNRDTEYVKTLTKWETKNLPKINKK